MSVTLDSPSASESVAEEQRFVLGRIRWDEYLKINDAFDERAGVRMVYRDGKLTILSHSKRHEWLAECFGYFVIAVAGALRLQCEPSGEATYRRQQKGVGLEGDRTFFFGLNALRSRGGRNHEFDVDPPPDLAIEIEVTHSANDAMTGWGRLGTPEVWRFGNSTGICTSWECGDDGVHRQIAQSRFLPTIEPADLVDQIRLAQEVGTAEWQHQIRDWVQQVVLPRLGGDASAIPADCGDHNKPSK